jgi:hypothetical protein
MIIYRVLYWLYFAGYNKYMDTPSTYADLSLITEKAIDVTFLVNKIKVNGYSIVALDQ